MSRIIIHLPTDVEFIVTVCGREITERMNMTNDTNTVTCKQCYKQIKNNYQAIVNHENAFFDSIGDN